jgi:formate/nitrite transporter FocA (FNT family)
VGAAGLSLGYSVGFVIVIMGSLQLFTESTVTAVLPLAMHPTMRNVGRLLGLWATNRNANIGRELVDQSLS